MYLSIWFCNVYNNSSCSMVRIFCLDRTVSADNDTRLQTMNINKIFDLHSKFVYEVIALHHPQEKCFSKMWQSNAVIFGLLHQIEGKRHKCEK